MSRFGALLALQGAVLLLSACGAAPPAAPPPLEVTVVAVSDAPVPLPLSYTARTRGEREVEVRARVSGILLRRFYREGAEVAQGERLFLIDPAPFQANVRSAQGRLGIEEARLNAATRQWRRASELAARGFVSGRGRDEAEAEYATSRASVAAARAELARARLDLGYTDVRAPIGGMTGLEARSEGSLVDAEDESALLTTITQADRLHVDFSMPEEEARLLRDAVASNPEAVRVRLQPTGRPALPVLARIEFVHTRVTPGTGTVDVRATLDNGAAGLSPGQFVRADVVGITTESAIFIPARAVLHGADGPFVWVVDGKHRARIQPVRVGPAMGNLLRVEHGLKPGDRVAIDSVLKLQPEMVVKAVAVPLERTAGPAAS